MTFHVSSELSCPSESQAAEMHCGNFVITYIHTYIHIHGHMYVHTCVCTYIHMYIRVYNIDKTKCMVFANGNLKVKN